MSDVSTVIEKLSSYYEGIEAGDLAEVRLAVKARLWLGDLDATPEEIVRTNELLDEVQVCLERQPTADQHGAVGALRRAGAYWLKPARFDG